MEIVPSDDHILWASRQAGGVDSGRTLVTVPALLDIFAEFCFFRILNVQVT